MTDHGKVCIPGQKPLVHEGSDGSLVNLDLVKWGCLPAGTCGSHLMDDIQKPRLCDQNDLKKLIINFSVLVTVRRRKETGAHWGFLLRFVLFSYTCT